MHEVGVDAASPTPSPEAASFLQADDALKRAAQPSK
jgi:hypothetical protein